MRQTNIILCLLMMVLHSTVLGFGGWSISLELFQFIRTHLPAGKTILELGSGTGTRELANYYTMYSVEHDKQWLNKFATTYIYAPIRNYNAYAWYDHHILSLRLPINYDLILVDGPPGSIGRYGFYHNLNLFKKDVLIIFDDVDREPELKLLLDVAKKFGRSYAIYSCKDGKKFGVLLNSKRHRR